MATALTAKTQTCTTCKGTGKQTVQVETHSGGTVSTSSFVMGCQTCNGTGQTTAAQRRRNQALRDAWCKCAKPETGRIEPRGHSLDVWCKHCDNKLLQVG